VLCLFLPFSFVSKIVVGFFVLILFMVLALLRLGPDRVPPEIWLKRRIRYGMDVRKYVNQREPSGVNVAIAQKPEPPFFVPAAAQFQPLNLAWAEVGVYPLLTASLGVVAVYFSVWLARGGANQLAIWFK
jgi:hypothetical protein